MKQVLIETQAFNPLPGLLSEGKMSERGNPLVTGILATCEVKNGNGRYYSKDLWQREIDKYMELVKENRACGELDHPESQVVNLKNVSHNIKDISWDGDNIMGTIEILPTPSGNILKALIDNGIKVGVSSRGMGSLEQRNGANYVKSDFMLATAADIVADPSAPDAFVQGIMESKEWVWDNGRLVERDVDAWRKEIRSASRRKLEEKKLEIFGNFLKNL